MKHLKLSFNQGVLSVILNRPEKRNAFFPEMIHEISTTFKKTLKEKDLRAVLLTGAGNSFCAGGDLQWMKSMAGYTAKQNLQDAERLYEMFWSVRICPVPVIGKVFGHAFGGGAGLAACCDFVAAETATQFSFSEVKWGLIPAVISPFVVDRVQPMRVREWFTSAKVFTAAEAREGGLVSFAGDMVEVDAYLENTFNLIATAAAPEAVRATKKLLLGYSNVNWKKARPTVTKLIATARSGLEGQRGLQAFLNKQNPEWSKPPYGARAKI